MTQLLVKLRPRNPRKPDYAKIASLERNLGLPSTVSERDKLRAEWTDPYRENSYVVRQREKRRKRILVTSLALMLCSCLVLAAWYVTFRTEAFTITPRPLPAGVLVGPSASYVVAHGQDGLGAVLCNGAGFETSPLGKRVLINCADGSPKFSYPKSKVWRP
jgi:hypothetical protein